MIGPRGRVPRPHPVLRRVRAGVAGRVDCLDALQRRRRGLGFPFAVAQKYLDDQGGSLAALLAHDAFLSVLPALVVLLTLLGIVLGDHPVLEQQVHEGAAGLLPLSAGASLHPLAGSWPVLVAGLAVAAWNGLGVAQQAQVAFNTVYDVPRHEWPGALPSVLRSAAAVVLGGGGLVATTLLCAAITSAGTYGVVVGGELRVLSAVVALAADTLLFTLLFRSLTAVDLGWRDVLPGAVVAAVGWYALQLAGTALVAHQLTGAASTYGTFATVIGLLWFFQVLAQVTLVAAEVNAVRAGVRWPRGLRGLAGVPTTDADRRSYRAAAERDRLAAADVEHVAVTFTPSAPDPSPRA